MDTHSDAGRVEVFATAVECPDKGALACTAPSDKMYAQLVGMYLPDLVDISISGTELEGATAVGANEPNGTIEFLFESLQA